VKKLLVLLAIVSAGAAQTYDTKLFADMRWREIGPYRGGRTRALAGVPTQPNVFYIGAVNGGVWKTNDYGRTWNPIFDHEPTGSIGAIAVAPSDPSIIYGGSGEGLQRPDLSTGDGIYKSIDAGQTWTHLGLRDGQQIPHIAVDPRDANRLFVAVLGHPYGPNEERGLYRSTDGAKNFQRILYKNENNPSNPSVVYAGLWESRQGPWENAAWSGTGGGIFKSTDGGDTWKQLTQGLPSDGVVQANLAIAPSDSKRIYAAVASPHALGIYRSDDAGDSWSRVTTDPRPAARIGGGDLAVPAVDPKNPDIVYTASTVTWKSTDGGKTWTGIRGAPGGDDYQSIWMNPQNPDVSLIVSDQGAIVTVNGGQTWSSWYNQPTAQMYHVAADNAFPYRVCGGQQESGSACVASRGNDGEITFRDWHPVGAEEYGNAVPDPLDADIVYGGKVTRYNRRTGQTQDVSPKPMHGADYRTVRTQPLVFSPIDPHTLYFASNTVWKTRDGGNKWQQISPDLTRKTWEVPATVGKYRDEGSARPTQRGVVYTLGLSPLDMNRIWAGTDDGLIQLTTDGGAHWNDVTPPQLTPWAKVSIIEPSHFDRGTAYAAINTFRVDDLKPHIYRTQDSGKSWTEIVNGIPHGAAVNVVREDPKRKGLLYAGSEREVYVSFDDGEHWQSLRLNMPATSIRDLLIKDDDLIAATHGRGFWILDDLTPLRQITPSMRDSATFLFQPETAIRVRWNMNTDTPLPPDTPAGQNPPDGAIIDYYLGPSASGPVSLEVLESDGKIIRRYSSTDTVPQIDPMLEIPKYWVRPPAVLSNQAGMHRFLWDMHYPTVPETHPEYPIAAAPYATAPEPSSPWVMPGSYSVRLTADGQTYTHAITVKMDPRVHTPLAGLTQQFALSKQVYEDRLACSAALEQMKSLRAQMKQISTQASAGPVAEALHHMDEKASALEGSDEARRGARGGGTTPDTLNSINSALRSLMHTLQDADVAPTTQAVEAVSERQRQFTDVMQRWSALKGQDLANLNVQLKQANLPAVTLEPVAAAQ
jgi:photosystem II stability/assembly factor-like uncharacterized protein